MQDGFKLNAAEIVRMAAYRNKKNLYGIPNILAALPVSQRAEAHLETDNELLDRGILKMDIDGNIGPNPEYDPFLNMCCDPDACLAFSYRDDLGTEDGALYWRKADSYMMAVATEGFHYSFYHATPDSPARRLQPFFHMAEGYPDSGAETLLIPSRTLQKAIDLIRSNEPRISEAKQLLRQNGVSQQMADDLAESIKQSPPCLTIVLTVNKNGQCNEQRVDIVLAGARLYSVSETVLDYISTEKISSIGGEAVRIMSQKMIDEFAQ